MAAALGWTAGVPGVQVRLHLMAEPYDSIYWHEATADSTGIATFPGLLYGLYEVEVTRPLTASEMETDSTIRFLAGGRRLYLPALKTRDITMAPAHRGSLVFSEFGFNYPPVQIGPTIYDDAMYFEIYNNSDTTIYLDGKYWGVSWDLNSDFSAWPCAQTTVVRNDPDGIWTQFVQRFPGGGNDHPLAPGRTALIAKAANDHRPVYPGLYNLTQADYEWGGARSADNPDVPNTVDVGIRPMGNLAPGPGQPLYLSDPVDLATLPRYTDPSSGYVYVRIPRALVLDASATVVDWAKQSFQATPACLEVLHRSFERLPGPAFAYYTDFPDGLSYQRRVLFVLPDGRRVLQDTETSMADFVKGLRTPGWIP